MGTALEWYDFFVFGALASVICPHFTARAPKRRIHFYLGRLRGGVRGASVRRSVLRPMGDRLGRKRAFLVTITLMGAATVGIGLLPTMAQVGLMAPHPAGDDESAAGICDGRGIRRRGGLCRRARRADRRGFLTSWIQITRGCGVVLAVGTVLGTRLLLGEDALERWGWRVPFLLSAALLGSPSGSGSIWRRVRSSAG